MSYQLKAHETFSIGVKRIAAEELGEALKGLQDFLSRLNLGLFEAVQRCHGCSWDGGLLETEIVRLERHDDLFRQALVLGVAAKIMGQG